MSNFVNGELERPEYEEFLFDELNDSNHDGGKAAKLRKQIIEMHSYRLWHGVMRPEIGGLLPWLRACRPHAEQNIIKLLLGNAVIFAIKVDGSEEGHFNNKSLVNSQTNLLLQVLFHHFQTRRVAKRILQTVLDKGRDITLPCSLGN